VRGPTQSDAKTATHRKPRSIHIHMKLLVPARQNSTYPAGPFFNLSQELERLFGPRLADTDRSERGGCPTAFTPALELREDADSYQVGVELPGVDKKDVEVTLHDGVLSISGERKQETEAKEGTYVRTERSYGRYQRQVSLPQAVDAGAIKATYKDGVLTITLPKTAEAKPKPINITAE
jgi:HSP20 family protein